MHSCVFSGIQATGGFHLGNYLGMIENFLEVSKNTESYLCIVDMHSMTTRLGENLSPSILNIAAACIASGVEADTIFVQSSVPLHTQLMWILSCVTSVHKLRHMIQFKEKSKDAHANLGLFSYPVLQAADILLYRATHVPVGEDQRQHIELTKSIAFVMNELCDKTMKTREDILDKSQVFVVPEGVFNNSARVMSLRDASEKMSKSSQSDNSRINLFDSPELIVKKISKAKSDSDLITADINMMKSRLEAWNLISIFASLQKCSPDDVCAKYDGNNFAAFKRDLADLLIASLAPARNEMSNLLNSPDYLWKALEKGADRARKRAYVVMQRIWEIFGIPFAG